MLERIQCPVLHKEGEQLQLGEIVLTTSLRREEKVQDMIRQAELSKARMFNTPGKYFEKLLDRGVDLGQVLSPTVVVDEGYFVVGAHLDESVVNIIGRGEYVDFGKLLQKDKVASADENCRFEMVIKKW